MQSTGTNQQPYPVMLTLENINMDITAAQVAVGLTFQDKTLLQRALTHRSYLNENPTHPLEDNERLEFLGDAVLDFITGEYLYHRFPEIQEGKLTNLRSALVRTPTLAKFAQQIDLGNYLNMGKGEEESGGRKRDTLLCGAFEALIGSIYLDQGLETTKKFVISFLKSEIEQILSAKSHRDPKSLFQELAQGIHKVTPTYKILHEHGPDHAKTFTVGAFLEDACYGTGNGSNKQKAAQVAAKEALKALQNEIKKEK